MPFISDTATAIKSRFGFHDHSSLDSVPSVRSSPALQKSASKEYLMQCSSAVRSIGNCDDDNAVNSGGSGPSIQSFEVYEDPSFWKDHNVQVVNQREAKLLLLSEAKLALLKKKKLKQLLLKC
jgi:kinesin family protein 15